jgi:hypothetical protein
MKEPVPRTDEFHQHDRLDEFQRKELLRTPFGRRLLPLPAPSRRGGRQTDLTDDVAQVICVALVNGNYRNVAAQYAGISEETLSRWMKRRGEPYETFQQWVHEAEAASEMRMVNAVTKRATDEPQYALQFLERKFPQRWGRAMAQPGVNVNLNLTSLLQNIETRATTVHDPRPPLPGRRTILDVLNEAPSVNGDEPDGE